MDTMELHNILIKNDNKRITGIHGESLFQALARNGCTLANSCGGNHTCGKCLVIIEEGDSEAISEEEARLLEGRKTDPGVRLACFVEVTCDMTISINYEGKNAQIIVAGESKAVELKPRLVKKVITLEPQCIAEQRDDYSKIVKALGPDKKRIPLPILKKTPEVIKSVKDGLFVVLREDEIIDIRGNGRENIYGLAVDIGTTTLAVYLLNLATGVELDVYSALNPQKQYGADVITRINHTCRNKHGLQELQELIVTGINRGIEVLCLKNGIDSQQIYEMVVVGNTTMLHLLLGIPCQNIANAPFIPAFTSDLHYKAGQLGIAINQEGYIIILPSVSAYVGADTIGAVIASGIHKDAQTNLLLDIGTNGEIVMGNKLAMCSCSTAAGPAFEGGNITFGVGGVMGAIDHIWLDREPCFSTIGEEKPVGICGSGVLDIAAQLLDYDVVDRTGRMRTKEELQGKIAESILARLVDYQGKPAFLVDESAGIYFTQGDIRELQLAKGAISTGIEVLFSEMGVSREDVNTVFLAGGFGNYLDIESAFAIKLLPEEFRGKITCIGNGAGIGAKMVLRCNSVLEEARQLRESITYVELSCSRKFTQGFIKALNF